MHALDEVFAGEVLNALEFLVPVVHLLGVNAVQGHDRGAELVSGGHLDLAGLRLLNPVVQGLGRRSQEEGLRRQDTVKVNLQVLAERLRQLVKAAGKSV